MKTMLETFASVFLISITCVFLISMISCYMLVNNARNYHLSVIDRLENSDFQEEFIDKIKEEAINRGYKLKIEDVSYKVTRPCYYVSLEYEIKANVLNIFMKILDYEGVIEGYAV